MEDIPSQGAHWGSVEMQLTLDDAPPPRPSLPCVPSSLPQLAPCASLPVRHLNMHEYQSKKLMRDHGVNIQSFHIAETPEEVGRAARKLGEGGTRQFPLSSSPPSPSLSLHLPPQCCDVQLTYIPGLQSYSHFCIQVCRRWW